MSRNFSKPKIKPYAGVLYLMNKIRRVFCSNYAAATMLPATMLPATMPQAATMPPKINFGQYQNIMMAIYYCLKNLLIASTGYLQSISMKYSYIFEFQASMIDDSKVAYGLRFILYIE